MNDVAAVIQGEALDELGKLEASSVDAIVCDPPYCSGGFLESQRTGSRGQGLQSETIARDGWFDGDNMGSMGLAWLVRGLAVHAFRVLKPQGSLLFFCDWRQLPALVAPAESSGLRYRSLVVWDKGYGALGVGFRARHEIIVHLAKGGGRYYARDVGNVVECGRIGRATERLHYTEKPLALMRTLIRVVAPRGGLVVDPFAGSGSTLVAARQLGIRALGIERDPRFVEVARKRLESDEAAEQGGLYAANGDAETGEQAKFWTDDDEAAAGEAVAEGGTDAT
jgi:site-specific DNA-methyltransferase (adenine-specific)